MFHHPVSIFFEPSLNDYSANTAVHDAEVHLSPIQSPEAELDDSEQNSIQSNSDPCMCPVIDLTEDSDPEPQDFASDNEPHHTLSDSPDSSSNHSQSSITSPQAAAAVNNATERDRLEASSSITVDGHGNIAAETQTQGPMPLLSTASASAMCSACYWHF